MASNKAVGSGKLTVRKAGLIGSTGSELAVDLEGEEIGCEVVKFKGVSLGISGGARCQHHSHDQPCGHSVLKDVFPDKLIAVGGTVKVRKSERGKGYTAGPFSNRERCLRYKLSCALANVTSSVGFFSSS